VKLRPEEITSILKQRIEELDIETDLAEKHGGTHGSPMSPLLNASLRSRAFLAAHGQSPAPPSDPIQVPTLKRSAS
jgi:hypothetical protein